MNLREVMFEQTEIPPDIKQRLVERIKECRQIFLDHYKVELPPISYKFDIKGRLGGQFRSQYIRETGQFKFTLRLNPTLMNENADHYLHTTVGHEMAHYLVCYLYSVLPYKEKGMWRRMQSHGYEWADAMRVLGLPADRTHSYDTKNVPTKKNYVNFTCNCPGKVFNLSPWKAGNHDWHVKRNGKGYFCPTCKASLVKQTS